MLESQKENNSASGVADRRTHQRAQVKSLAYVELDQEMGALILNLGEGGIGVQASDPLVGMAFPKMRFRLPRSNRWIEVAGNLVWESSTRREAGISFVHLTEDDRQQIRDWVYSETTASHNPEEAHFKIVWENSETAAHGEDSPPGAVSSDFESMFPSEKDLPSPPNLPKCKAIGADAGPGGAKDVLPAVSGPVGSPLESYDLPIVPPVVDPESSHRNLQKGAAVNPAASRRLSGLGSGFQGCVRDLGETGNSHETISRRAAKAPASASQKRAQEPERLEQGGCADELPNSRVAASDARKLREAWIPPESGTERPRTVSTTSSGISFTGFGYQPSAFEEPSGKGWIAVAATLVLLLIAGAVMAMGPANVKSLMVHYFRNHSSADLNVAAPPPPAGASEQASTASSAQPSQSVPAKGNEDPAPAASTSEAPVSSADASTSNTGQQTSATLQEAAPVNDPEPEAETPEEIEAKVRKFQLEHSGVAARAQSSEYPVAENRGAQPSQQPAATPSAPPSAPAQTERTLNAHPQATQPNSAGAKSTDSGPQPVLSSPVPANTGTVAISSHFQAIKGTSSAPSGSLKIGQLTSFREPAYPVEAIRTHVEGVVALQVVVDQIGAVENVRFVSGPPLLAAAAINAVKQWHYGQTVLNNQAVETVENVTVSFRLGNSASSPRE